MTLHTVALFESMGIVIITSGDNIDISDERSKLLIPLQGMYNERFLADLREKTLRGMKGRKREGYFVVGYIAQGRQSKAVEAALEECEKKPVRPLSDGAPSFIPSRHPGDSNASRRRRTRGRARRTGAPPRYGAHTGYLVHSEKRHASGGEAAGRASAWAARAKVESLRARHQNTQRESALVPGSPFAI